MNNIIFDSENYIKDYQKYVKMLNNDIPLDKKIICHVCKKIHAPNLCDYISEINKDNLSKNIQT